MKNGVYTFHYIGKDTFVIKEDAIKKAEDIRKKKIALIRKQIVKLEKLSFNE